MKKAEETKGMLLQFLNQETNQWLDCRYNFYRSSQSYELTKGWSKYAKANFLKEKDVIKFCECSKEMGECDERYIMIEIVKWGEEEKREELTEGDNGESCFSEKGVWLFGVLIGRKICGRRSDEFGTYCNFYLDPAIWNYDY